MKGRVLADRTTDSVVRESHLRHGGERTKSDELRLGLNRENNSNNMWVSSSGGKSMESAVRPGDLHGSEGSFKYERHILETKACR